jgi:hypothetical protein
MRYLCIYRPGTPERTTPPTQEEMTSMGELIMEMTKAGVMLTFSGCAPSAHGARIRVDGGSFTVTDGPFPETKELVAGFCLMQVKSKAEAVEWAKRFLSVAGVGESEIRLIHEAPPAHA